MQYMGGKSRIGARVASEMNARRCGERIYLEPFVGAGWMLYRMAPRFTTVYAGEINEDLVLLYAALQAGWEPPASVSREDYEALRHAEPSALRAFVGFGLSFGGKWFRGYASNTRGDDFCGAARRSLLRKLDGLRGVTVQRRDYREWSPGPGWLVYCDPPYSGTENYRTGTFNSGEFWATAKAWAQGGASVFVSEYACPLPGVDPVWQHQASSSMRKADNARTATERLYWFPPGGDTGTGMLW